MDKDMLEKALKMTAAENDSDAVMGLRALQGLFKAEALDLGLALAFALERAAEWKGKGAVVDQAGTPAASSVVTVSGMPQCRIAANGDLEIIPPGKTGGALVHLPEAVAPHAAAIANGLKDALAAAVINKSRFKLKLFDIKNSRGDVVETALQAEYERDGMTPVRVWLGVRGEVAALATVLRSAVANAVPELMVA